MSQQVFTPRAPRTAEPPTVEISIDGIKLRPADRLAALAATRDRHRANARFASDKMHALRERLVDARRRLDLLRANANPAFATEIEGQTAVIQAEIDQIAEARADAQREAEEASASAGEADCVLREALQFCRANGIVVPVILEE